MKFLLTFFRTYRFLILGLLFIGTNNSTAQNLFPNPSFEQYSACPNAFGQVSQLEDWTAGNAATPDYYNCSFAGSSIQGTASDGTGVLGFWGGANHPACPTSGYSENVVGSLITELQAGSTYEVTFDLQIDGAGFNSNGPSDCMQVGFYFYDSTNPPPLSSICCETVTPQITVMGSEILQGSYQTFTRSFVASDSWDRVLIGTFCTPESSSPACSNYSTNKMYFNLDNILLQESIVLPAELVDFEAGFRDGKSELEWLTANESDLMHFEVQRCTGNCADQENYEYLGTVTPNINSISDYSFDDVHPISGINYYRLKVVDVNGAYTYSSVVEVLATAISPIYKLFPNPTSSNAVLQVDLPAVELLEVSCSDMAGKRVWITQVFVDKGRQNLSIPTSILPEGTYIVNINSENNQEPQYIKLVKRP